MYSQQTWVQSVCILALIQVKMSFKAYCGFVSRETNPSPQYQTSIFDEVVNKLSKASSTLPHLPASSPAFVTFRLKKSGS